MIIGIPKEVKNNENRVSNTPSGAAALVKAGHRVLVQKGAGEGSGFGDEEYAKAGAKILERAADVWNDAQLIVKVKEPIHEEFGYLREDMMLFTYLHLAADRELADQLIDKKTTSIAYETVTSPHGGLPLLAPMSEVAGRMAVPVGAYMLMKYNGGRGVLLGGVPGVMPSEVVIVGGGNVGFNAARIALGFGARVTVLDVNIERMTYIDQASNGHIHTLFSNEYNVRDAVKNADLLIGAVLIPGAKAPKIVTEDMVKLMRPGSVIVDVAVDQGGCVETLDHATTHDEPTYIRHGVIHYAVANMPGAVPRTSTMALSGATLPYTLKLAARGIDALKEDAHLYNGLNTYQGQYTHQGLADSFGLPWATPAELF